MFRVPRSNGTLQWQKGCVRDLRFGRGARPLTYVPSRGSVVGVELEFRSGKVPNGPKETPVTGQFGLVEYRSNPVEEVPFYG